VCCTLFPFSGFGMAVAFWVSRTCSLYFDFPLITEVSECFGDKLQSIIGEDFVWEAMSTYNVFPDEILYYSRGDVLERFGFYTFGEVVC